MRTLLLILMRPVLSLLLTLVLLSIGSVWMQKYYLLPYSPLMLSRIYGQLDNEEPMRLRYKYVPLEAMNSQAPIVLVAAQDPQYLTALGVPQAAVDEFTAKQNKTKKKKAEEPPIKSLNEVVAHNLFYLPWDNILTRLKDKYFAWLISLIWPEKRVVEVYLNIVELGPGVYGLGAAADAYFSDTADHLTAEQLALLAAALPNPRLLRADKPDEFLTIRKNQLLIGIKTLPDLKL